MYKMYDFSLINTCVYMYVCFLSSKTDFHIQCCKIKMNYTFNIIFLNQKVFQVYTLSHNELHAAFKEVL